LRDNFIDEEKERQKEIRKKIEGNLPEDLKKFIKDNFN